MIGPNRGEEKPLRRAAEAVKFDSPSQKASFLGSMTASEKACRVSKPLL